MMVFIRNNLDLFFSFTREKPFGIKMNSLANVHVVNFPTSAKEQCTATVQNYKTMNYIFTVTKKPNHVHFQECSIAF